MVMIPFGEWRPDVADLNSAFIADLRNALPASSSYMPFPASEVYTAPLPSAPLGAFMALPMDGLIYLFAGTEDGLFVLNNTTKVWANISKVGGYNATSLTPWDFALFGNFVIAVNKNDPPQVFEIGLSTAFADLAGSPPRAGRVSVWGDFVALCDLTDFPNRVQWSGLDNHAFWTPGSQNSDYQTFPDGGRVTGTTNATNPIIFQAGAIRLATFVPGSVEIFTFQKLHDKRGAKSPYSITDRGAVAFFVDDGGFFQIGADGSLGAIGKEKVDRTILTPLSGEKSRLLSGVVDMVHTRVYWSVPGPETDEMGSILVYDWELGRWSRIYVQHRLLFSGATTGYTLDGLDAIYPNLDTMPFSLDSGAFKAGAPLLAMFDTLNRLCFFSGRAMEAQFTTQEAGDTSGSVSTITSVYAITDSASVAVSIGSRFRRTDNPVFTQEALASSKTGMVRKKSRGRFHRFRVRIPADEVWSHAQGVDAASVPSGAR